MDCDLAIASFGSEKGDGTAGTSLVRSQGGWLGCP